MKTLLTFVFLLLALAAEVFSQESPETKFSGTYQSTDILELSLSVKKMEQTFEVQFMTNDQLYLGAARPFLGVLSGSYNFNGNLVQFTISRIMGQYLLTSEGYDIPLSKTSEISADLSQLISKPTETAPNPSSNHPKPRIETESTRQVHQRIAGKRLLYLHTANGGSDKKFFDLCSDGTFYYYSYYSYLSGEFSQSVKDEDFGTWEVSAIGNELGLLIYTQKGENFEIILSQGSSENELIGNGRRYFLTTNETCK
ncbi:hypothetical protein [Algoriphagus litoralis]|uniref:hypothetical protein n=1 Tax=Algoriphagus litoralis TaxID=2202829 RepID=UPI000DB9204F|nr:hypothetical protein [Algoriphagus litoralis]